VAGEEDERGVTRRERCLEVGMQTVGGAIIEVLAPA
jgi:hypothetical protein